MPSHLPKSPFTRWDMYGTVPFHQGRWWSPDGETTPRYFFSFSPCEGLLFACLGCERRTLAASKILPEKRGSKTNRAVCIQVGAEPQNHSLACGSQHSVPALTSPKTNTLNTRPPQPEAERNLRKSLDSNSINKCSPHPLSSTATSRTDVFTERWANADLFTNLSLV